LIVAYNRRTPLVYISIGWLGGIWIISLVTPPTEAILIVVVVPLIGLVL
jgi:hypothetical protein